MNTKNVLEIAKVSSLLAVSFMCVTLGITALRLGTTVQKANANIDLVQQDIHRLVQETRITMKDINHAAIDERFYFEKQMPAVVDQVQGILGDTHRLLVSANTATETLSENQNKLTDQAVTVLKTTDTTISHVDVVLGQANNDLAQLEVTEKHLDALIQSPDITQTLKNVDATTASTARTMNDIEDEVHTITHPRLIVSIANWTLKVVHSVGGMFL
jgi:uncharacterized protein YoxC